MSLRSKQARERRARILDATASLIRSTKGTDFPMLDIAAKAEVSPATLYNLFGTKNGLFYALLNHMLDELMESAVTFSSGEPCEHPIEAALIATDVFAADPVLYRPLFLVMLGVPDEARRSLFLDRSLDYWRHSLDGADRLGWLTPPLDREDLARALIVHYIGVLDLWAHEDLDGPGFRAQVVYGTALHVLPVTPPEERDRLLAHLESARSRMPESFSFGRPARRSRARKTVVLSTRVRSKPARPRKERADGSSSSTRARAS